MTTRRAGPDSAPDDAIARQITDWYAAAVPDAGDRARHLQRMGDMLHDDHPPSPSPNDAPHAGRVWRWRHRHSAVASTALAAVAAFAFVFLPRDPARRATSGTSPAALSAAVTARAREIPFEIRLREVNARQVTLAGDFNGWNVRSLPMVRDAGLHPAANVWRIRIALPAGRHTYSFVVDGMQWVIDPLAPRSDEGALGATNVITVAGES